MCDRNPVGELQELAQAAGPGAGFPQYELAGAAGEPHCPEFSIRVVYAGHAATATGTNKREAKRAAAAQLLAVLRPGAEQADQKQPGDQETSNGKQPR